MIGPTKEKKEKKKEPEKKEKSDDIENDLSFLLNMGKESTDSKLRVTGVYGDLTEERCSEVLYSMLLLQKSGEIFEPSDPDDADSELIKVSEPFDFFISTFGGSALEMFSLYDVMRQIRESMPIHTIGIGKVMSAGTLLLAAGTKGERRVGKYCRIMIHGVISGQHGHLADIENEFDEAKFTQKMYVEALAEETNMTQTYLKNLIKKKTNVYLSADEAVDLGIADMVI